MKLLELRKEKKLTQKEIALKLKTTQSNYGKYELGLQEPNIQTLCQLADLYNVSLDYLVEHETSNLLDLSNYSETKKGCIFLMDKINEQNAIVLLGYLTHMVYQQEKN